MLGMTDVDLTPLCLLEWLFKEDEIPKMPGESHADVKRVGRRNMWYGVFPVVMSRWVKWEFGNKKWLKKSLVVCIEKMYQLWTENCRIVHKCTM